MFVNGGDTRRKTWLRTKTQGLQTEILEMDVLVDHVQRLIQCDPPFDIHRLVKPLKGSTSHVLGQEFPSLKRR